VHNIITLKKEKKRMSGSVARVFNALHGYIYGRWSKKYIHVLLNDVFPNLGPRGKKWWAGRFHFKVLTQKDAKAIITIDKDIPLRDLEQIIPYPMARDLVLKAPPDIVVYECSCRHTRAEPCQPTQVCLIIGQPFVDFILEHHPRASRRIGQEEAVELIEAEHKRGHIQTAWFKDAMGGRFYALCNCCRCCCFGMEAVAKYAVPMAASSGYVAHVDKARCEACATCEEMCPFEAIQVTEAAVVHWETCMGCGVCVGQCPSETMTLVRDKRKGVPLDVRLLAREQALS
jgi:NAD-dependent dihydropyrimidine dehydrogenase PreA subunit